MSAPDEERIRQFVVRTSWTAAKQFPENPHEYHILSSETDQDGFYRLIGDIRLHGLDRPYMGRNYRYLKVGDHEYWEMLTNDGKPIINRRRIG